MNLTSSIPFAPSSEGVSIVEHYRIEEELQGTHYRASNLCSKVPGSCVVAALMLLPQLLSLRPRPQQHNRDNPTTAITTLSSIVIEIVISIDVIIILSLALLELTKPFSFMVHSVLLWDYNQS
jgi:hypothetical protein